MGAAIVLAVLSAATVSLSLGDGLKCPNRGSLAARLERVGLHVVPASATFEVKLEPGPDAVHMTARRVSDGKVFDRSVPSASEPCGTVERLVVVLIHSWAQVGVPAVYPQHNPKESQTDAGT